MLTIEMHGDATTALITAAHECIFLVSKEPTLFGKRKKPPPTPTNSPSDMPKQRTLSMVEVYALAYEASLERGWPEPASQDIAESVIWLDRRNQPGLLVLTLYYLANAAKPITENPRKCPLFFGVRLLDDFDKLATKEDGGVSLVEAPEACLLILPKVAKCARHKNCLVRILWCQGPPFEIVAHSVTDGDRAVSQGDHRALLACNGVGFVQFEPGRNPGYLTGSPEPMLTSALFPLDLYESLHNFIGPRRMNLVETVDRIMRDESELLDLLRSLGPGDRSTFEVIGNPKVGDTPKIFTTIGSPNDKLWSRLVDYGWAVHMPSNELPDEIRKFSSIYQTTEVGCQGVQLLLALLARFPVTRH